MEPITISLNPNPEYWQEMYFANGNGTLLESQRVKYSYRYFILCSALLIIFFGLDIYDPSFRPGLWGAAFFFVLCSIDFYRKLKSHYKWRKKIIKHLKGFHNFKKYDLVLSDESIMYVTNISSSKDKWSSMEKVEITKRGLRLYTAKSYYVIPKKAMSEEDFNILFNFAETQINNSVYEPEVEEIEYKGSKWSN